jgi:lysophospholipase L1-like esterase
MAEQSLRRRRAAARSRQKALAAHPRLLTRATTARGVGALAPAKALVQATAGVLIAEGDSWFDYPLNDVLKGLEDDYGYDVESVAHKGDTVEDMAYSDGQLDELARRLEKVLRSGVRPRAILLSGGGNDIAGDPFAVLLNHAASGIAGINDSVVTGIIDQRLADAYVTILSAVTTICESQLGEPIRIVIHGYDYPVPDGRGFLGGWAFLPGPWLEPGFRQKRYDAMSVRLAMLKTLIDRFNQMLRTVSRIPRFAHVKYLDLRGTLSTGGNYRDWWANELHPTGKGFAKVTEKFAAVL